MSLTWRRAKSTSGCVPVSIVLKRRNRSLRAIFDQDAELYDELRPGYPERLIENILSISDISSDGRILEIGCGTGQATIPFAERGYSILCLEIGRNLAALAAEKLSLYPNVEIQNTSFEDWPPLSNCFDLVISATSFHWIPPEIAYSKTADILKDTGHLAIFSNLHPTPYAGFFEVVQDVYKKIVPEWEDPRKEPSFEEKVKLEEQNIDSTGLFEKALVKRYHWTKEYDTEQYLRLINTYSGHRSLDEERRSQLFRAIGELIDNEYGGLITRP